MADDNTIAVLHRLIAELQIPLTLRTLKEDLQKHSDSNSLLAVSEVLDYWHISNAAYNLTFDSLLQAGIDQPFIAYVAPHEFLLVNKFDSADIVVYNKRKEIHKLSIEEFKRIYLGSILVAEKDDTSGDPDYVRKHRKDMVNKTRIPAVLGTSLLLLLMWFFSLTPSLSAFDWQVGLLIVINGAGTSITALLLTQSIDAKNPLIRKLCGEDRNKSCNAILSSKAAMFSQEISWSEIGFFYFLGTWVGLLFNNQNLSLLSMFAVLNVLSLPYTLYSIFYQWRVAKQWCKLCCVVQLLLWLNFLAFRPFLLSDIKTPSFHDWLIFATCIAIPILAWVVLKPYLILSREVDTLKVQLRGYKYNKKIFSHFLNEQPQYVLPEEDNTIVIGNRAAEKTITIVSNPYCQPCEIAHKELEWLEARDDVKLQLIFSTKSETDRNAKIALHLLAMKEQRNDVSLKKAIDDWYHQKEKNYDTWAKVHPNDSNYSNVDALAKQRDWCKFAGITGTPTLFLNGRRLPQNYHPGDLKYFI